jgi:hypothetical protein
MEQIYEILPSVRKQFNGSVTQAKSFDAITASGERKTQKLKVLSIIEENYPICIRMIAMKANLEITAVCRCIKDLEQNEPALIRIHKNDRSNITGRLVQFYGPAKVVEVGDQIELFC